MIDIYCNDQSVEIDDTLVSFIDLFWFWPISSIYIGRYICSSKNENWNHANSKFIDNWVAIKSQRTKHLLLVTVCRHFLTGFQDLDFPPFQNNVGVVRGVDRILTAFRISRVNFRENMWTFREDKGIYLSLTYGCSRSWVPLHDGIYDVNRKVRKCQHETVISVNNWYFKKFCYELCMLSFQSQLLLTATEPWNNLHVYNILYLEVLTSYISVVTFLAFI